MDYRITTNTESYVKWFESIKRGYHYCLKRYPEEDFEIETYIPDDSDNPQAPF